SLARARTISFRCMSSNRPARSRSWPARNSRGSYRNEYHVCRRNRSAGALRRFCEGWKMTRVSVAKRVTRKRKRPGTAAIGKPPSAHTPRCRVFIAMSLDGYIADARGGVEWLNPYFSPETDFDGFMKSIGATVMGRATFDQAFG